MDVHYVIQRINSGAKVRFMMDFYGQTIVEVARGWPLGKARIKLPHNEVDLIKQALLQRRRETVAVA
jgi:hypothetical protein